jgi:peptide/nickel transport system ATP-binding protein
MIKGKNLSKVFESGMFSKRKFIAVDDVNIEIKEGETLCLIGESGSGKSTLGRMLLNLIEPTSGEVIFDNYNIAKMKQTELRKIRRYMQLIPQYPDSALNPRWAIKNSILEPLKIHKLINKNDGMEKLEELIETVGLKKEHLSRYPHELSGGELQRAVIARAISLKPKFIVCDEPTSMLDVSVQASIINLLLNLQKKYNLSYLFITHDLEIANIVGQRFAVMYGGQILEEGNKIMDKPLHPYTELLVKSLTMDEDIESINELLDKTETKKSNNKSGCKYYHLCPYHDEKCLKGAPPVVEIDDNRKVRCFRYA